MVLEKTLESPLDCKEIQPVHFIFLFFFKFYFIFKLYITVLVLPGDQSWVFIGRTDAKDKTPVLQPLDAKSRLTGKTLMLGKIEGRRRKGR